MDLNLKDKVIFVAGASRGIGLGIVEACMAEGAKVAIAARGADALEEQRARLAGLYGEDKVWARAGDLRDSATIDSMIDAIETDFGPPMSACIPARPALKSTTRPGMAASARISIPLSSSPARPCAG